MSGDKSQEQNSSSTEFLERRRAALERYLNRTAAHPVLSIDPDFREFLEASKLIIFLSKLHKLRNHVFSVKDILKLIFDFFL